MQSISISIIEDEVHLLEIMTIVLSEKGHKVKGYPDSESFLQDFDQNKPDIILTDKNLPGKNGLELVKDIRAKNSSIPIFMISGRANVDNNIEAFKLGVDDFINKPFDYDILEAKIKRAFEKTLPKKLHSLHFSEETHEVQKGKKKVVVTQRELLIFKELLNKRGNLVKKDFFTSNNLETGLDVHMHSLRKKLASLKLEIKTVKGKGYYLKV